MKRLVEMHECMHMYICMCTYGLAQSSHPLLHVLSTARLQHYCAPHCYYLHPHIHTPSVYDWMNACVCSCAPGMRWTGSSGLPHSQHTRSQVSSPQASTEEKKQRTTLVVVINREQSDTYALCFGVRQHIANQRENSLLHHLTSTRLTLNAIGIPHKYIPPLTSLAACLP
jgi:hypothetical protein